MNPSAWLKIGLGMLGVAAIVASSAAGCGGSSGDATSTGTAGSGSGGSPNGTTTATTGTTTGKTAGTTTATSTATASGTTTISGTTTVSGTTTSSTGTGMATYTSCGECADMFSGAPMNECKSKYDACMGDAGCKAIYACAYNDTTGCQTDATGACCTFDCYTSVNASQASIDLYEAYDQCVYCGLCETLCSAKPYCDAFAQGTSGCK